LYQIQKYLIILLHFIHNNLNNHYLKLLFIKQQVQELNLTPKQIEFIKTLPAPQLEQLAELATQISLQQEQTQQETPTLPKPKVEPPKSPS